MSSATSTTVPAASEPASVNEKGIIGFRSSFTRVADTHNDWPFPWPRLGPRRLQIPSPSSGNGHIESRSFGLD
jgi:hypothetical protein